MILIKPRQISGEIMTLMEEAEEKLILVCPYYRISKWYKLLKCFKEVQDRDVHLEIYVRSGELESISELESNGFNPIPVPDLHAKFYMNENQAIVSSMNLLLSSDTNSLDIALRTENQGEYEELFKYYSRYIAIHKHQDDEADLAYDWYDDLESRLTSASGKNTRLYVQNDGSLHISGRNRYDAFFERGKRMKMVGIFSGAESDFVTAGDVPEIAGAKVEVVRGQKGYYDTVHLTIAGLHSNDFNNLRGNEQKPIADCLVHFVKWVEEIKDAVRMQRYGK